MHGRLGSFEMLPRPLPSPVHDPAASALLVSPHPSCLREVAERIMRLREHIAKEMIEDLDRISHDNTDVLKRQAGRDTLGPGWDGGPSVARCAERFVACLARTGTLAYPEHCSLSYKGHSDASNARLCCCPARRTLNKTFMQITE